jgi:transcriptional regulator with XRE-family HTH domain
MAGDVKKGPPQNARARRICEARHESSILDARIADVIGVARTSVTNWQVRGNISLDHLREYADLMGVSFNWIAFGEGEKSLSPYILVQLRKQYPETEWAPEHAELFRTLFMKTKDGSLTEGLVQHLNTVIEGLAGPALQRVNGPTEKMVDSAAKAAPYLNREAVREIVKAAIDQ